MHEMSLMADLLNKVESVARQAGADRVVGVRVRLGALSHLSEAHFREHFGHGSRGTLAEGARLEVETSEDTSEPTARDVVLKSVELAV